MASKLKIPKIYGGVTLMASLITGNCLVSGDYERLQRLYSFDNDFMEYNFTDKHQKEVGDDTASMGFPDDGNGRYM